MGIPVSVIREPDDQLAESRISIEKPRGMDGLYIVFRGEPEATLQVLRDALAVAEHALPTGHYEDKRGRPQG